MALGTYFRGCVSMFACKCVCVHLCVCMCTCVYIRMCTYACMCVCDLITGWYLVTLVITTISLPKSSVVEEQEKTKSERRKKTTMFVKQLLQKRGEILP